MVDYTAPQYPSVGEVTGAGCLAGYSFDWGLTNGHDYVSSKGAQVTIVTSPTPPRSNKWLQFNLTGASPAGRINFPSSGTPSTPLLDGDYKAPNGGIWGLLESFDLRIDNLPSGGNFQLGSRDSSDNSLVEINTSGQLLAGSSQTPSARVLAADTDYHVQIFCVPMFGYDKAVNLAVIVRVNGEVWTIGQTKDALGASSQYGSNTQLSTTVWLGNYVRGWIDVTRPIPKFRVLRLNPTADGTYETGVVGDPDNTDKWNNWKENDPDNDTSDNLMQLPGVGGTNRYTVTLDDLPTGDDPWLVSARIVYREGSGTGTKAMEAFYIFRSGGVDLEAVSVANVADTNWYDHSGLRLSDPSGTAWTETSVNGLEIGLKQTNSNPPGGATTIKASVMFADVVVDSASDSDTPPLLPMFTGDDTLLEIAAAVAGQPILRRSDHTAFVALGQSAVRRRY